MFIDIHSPLFAAFLNSFVLRMEMWVTNWLTPIWIIGFGALIGMLVVAVLIALGWAGSLTPLSSLSENSTTRWAAGVALGLALFVGWYPYLKNQVAPNAPLMEQISIYAPGFLISLIVGVAIFSLFSRKFMKELPILFQEGPVFWIFMVIASFALYGILGVVLVRDPDGMIESMRRWPSLGRSSVTFEIEAAKDENAEAPEVELPVHWKRSEVRFLEFESSESLRVAAVSMRDKASPPSWDISGGEALKWKMALDPSSPLVNVEEVTNLYARNLGNETAQLTIHVQTAPSIPELLTVPTIAAAVLSLFLLFVLLLTSAPKVSAIALATAKSEMNTPFYMILMTVGSLLLFVFLWLPYNTFGEDIKMLKFTTLDVIRMLALLQAVWSASSSVAEEVEGKTALTVLSKPVGRRDFILGKYMGIAWLVLLMFVVYGAITLLCVAYKPVYDIREGGKAPDRPEIADPLGLVDVTRETGLTAEEVNWQICASEAVSTLPALVLVYCETLVLAAVSVAISTRLALVANFTICFALFALGHLTPLLVQSNYVAEQFEAVIFVGQLIATVIPVLDYFDTSAAIAQGKAVQIAYVGATCFYTVLYSAIAMLLAFVLFEDRDLA
jgi:ABC-2 family transporter protein